MLKLSVLCKQLSFTPARAQHYFFTVRICRSPNQKKNVLFYLSNLYSFFLYKFLLNLPISYIKGSKNFSTYLRAFRGAKMAI